MKDFTTPIKAPAEHVKQQRQELLKTLDSKLWPHENHTLFEYDTVKKQVVIAEFEPTDKEIHWNDAVNGNWRNKRSVLKKPNCLYIPCLNLRNLAKILFRDHNIILNEATCSTK